MFLLMKFKRPDSPWPPAPPPSWHLDCGPVTSAQPTWAPAASDRDHLDVLPRRAVAAGGQSGPIGAECRCLAPASAGGVRTRACSAPFKAAHYSSDMVLLCLCGQFFFTAFTNNLRRWQGLFLP